MKKFITNLLTYISPLGALPTAWAIYAGITEQPSFPVLKPVAVVGAMAVISTTAAAGLLIVDILKHNAEAANPDEQKGNIPVWYGWVILAGCTTAELVLSLLIVVFSELLEWGVMAFPLATLAGVFALAVRMTLEERIKDRVTSRTRKAQELAEAKSKEEAQAEKEKAERKESRARREQEKKELAKAAAILQQEPVKEPEPLPKVARKPVKDDELLAYLSSNPGETQQQVADHFGVSRQAIGQRIKKLYEIKQNA